MATRRKYRKIAHSTVIAIQLDLDTGGFRYQKWGAEQLCKSGDWIVNNNGDIYSIDQQVFAKTYRMCNPGMYVKTTPIWAEQATQSGSVKTKEGKSHYRAGDYLAYNNEDGSDAYCISATIFKTMYELDE